MIPRRLLKRCTEKYYFRSAVSLKNGGNRQIRGSNTSSQYSRRVSHHSPLTVLYCAVADDALVLYISAAATGSILPLHCNEVVEILLLCVMSVGRVLCYDVLYTRPTQYQLFRSLNVGRCPSYVLEVGRRSLTLVQRLGYVYRTMHRQRMLPRLLILD